ncbi:helix-turn-helix domain-containing protein [Latilactobacillus sakei]|uniref:helix-turn-helix domain-containing protein n=1 Tax=Latilactobacillus sakei TaxID=1599 RepID=UPI000DD473F0
MLTATKRCVIIILVNSNKMLLIRKGNISVKYIQITQDFKSDLISKKAMLTVQELAKRTEVNRWTVSDILNGRRSQVKQDTYRKLVNFIKEG